MLLCTSSSPPTLKKAAGPIERTPGEMVTEERGVSAKAWLPTEMTDAGMASAPARGAYMKAYAPIVMSESGSARLVRPEFMKAKSPIVMTDSVSSIAVSSSQPANACAPMVWMLVGRKWGTSSPQHCVNAFSTISVTLSSRGSSMCPCAGGSAGTLKWQRSGTREVASLHGASKLGQGGAKEGASAASMDMLK